MKTNRSEITSGAVTPPKAIVMMEDHDKAYYAWKENNVCSGTLVHIDAHIDFGWIPEIDLDEIGPDVRALNGPGIEVPLLNPFMKSRKKLINIGNYICPAIREGMVNKFYWVVPDNSWNTSRGRKHIEKQLYRLLKINRYSAGKLEKNNDRIKCRILNIDFIVCGLENLPRIESPVLLDVDVDFMLTKNIWDDLNPGRLPWILPEDLYERVLSRICSIEVLTIAYSVEGGFTPLKFKYFGDELRGFFGKCKPKAMGLKRKAFFLERDKNFSAAAGVYEEALKIDDNDASVYYNLALLSLESPGVGPGKAAAYYNEALRRDRTYATVYNNYGILYLQYNDLGRAEAEYRKFETLDGNNVSVLTGLGAIALGRGRFTEAEKLFDRCLQIDKASSEARAGKAAVYFKKGLFAQAKDLFWELKKDHPGESEFYWWLGRIAQKRGDVRQAIDNYKDAVLRGGDGPLVHLLLSGLYIRRRLYFRAFEELKRSFYLLRIISLCG